MGLKSIYVALQAIKQAAKANERNQEEKRREEAKSPEEQQPLPEGINGGIFDPTMPEMAPEATAQPPLNLPDYMQPMPKSPQDMTFEELMELQRQQQMRMGQ